MSFLLKWVIIAVESYLLGSLSFSIIVSKGIYKKDNFFINEARESFS